LKILANGVDVFELVGHGVGRVGVALRGAGVLLHHALVVRLDVVDVLDLVVQQDRALGEAFLLPRALLVKKLNFLIEFLVL